MSDSIDNLIEYVLHSPQNTNPAILRQFADEVAEGGSEVIANPTLEGDEDSLTGLEVDGVKYKVEAGGGDDNSTILLSCHQDFETEYLIFEDEDGNQYNYSTLENLLDEGKRLLVMPGENSYLFYALEPEDYKWFIPEIMNISYNTNFSGLVLQNSSMIIALSQNESGTMINETILLVPSAFSTEEGDDGYLLYPSDVALNMVGFVYSEGDEIPASDVMGNIGNLQIDRHPVVSFNPDIGVITIVNGTTPNEVSYIQITYDPDSAVDENGNIECTIEEISPSGSAMADYYTLRYENDTYKLYKFNIATEEDEEQVNINTINFNNKNYLVDIDNIYDNQSYKDVIGTTSYTCADFFEINNSTIDSDVPGFVATANCSSNIKVICQCTQGANGRCEVQFNCNEPIEITFDSVEPTLQFDLSHPFFWSYSRGEAASWLAEAITYNMLFRYLGDDGYLKNLSLSYSYSYEANRYILSGLSGISFNPQGTTYPVLGMKFFNITPYQESGEEVLGKFTYILSEGVIHIDNPPE